MIANKTAKVIGKLETNFVTIFYRAHALDRKC